MSDFAIDLKKGESISGDQENIINILKSISESVDNIAGRVTMKGEEGELIKQSLKIIGESLEAEKVSTQQWKDAFNEIVRIYQETEQKITANHLEKSADQAALEVLKKQMEQLISSLFGFQKGCCYGGDPVNMCTGNFIYQKTDLEIQNAKPIKFERYYNSMNKKRGSLSEGWSHNYEVELRIKDAECIICFGDGSEERFYRDEANQYTSEYHTGNMLIGTEDGFRYETITKRILEFSKEGNLLEEKNQNGVMNRLEYEGETLAAVLNGEGDKLSFSYNEKGYLAAVTDHAGRKISFLYQDEHLAEVIGVDGLSLKYKYDQMGMISEVMEQNGEKTVCNEYDPNGRVLKQSYPDGGIMELTYEDEKNEVHFISQNGSKIIYFHDEKMRHIKTQYENGEERFIYNEQNQKVAVIDKAGNITRYGYDNRGNVTSIINALGHKVMMATYDADNHLISLKGACKEQRKFHYDSKGNLQAVEDSLKRKTHFSYDENGQACRIEKPDQSVILLEYDNRGNIIKATDESGNTTEYGYNELSQVVWTKQPNKAIMYFEYDLIGRITQVRDVLGNVRFYEYSKTGKITKITDFDGSVRQWRYNCMDKVQESIDPNGHSTRIEYDLMWNVSKITQANGACTRFLYDNLNRLNNVENALGHRVYYRYDKNDNVVRIEDEQGMGVGFEYDFNNQQTAKIDAENNRTSYEYDQSGRLIHIINPKKQKTTYEYDSEGQKTAEIDAFGNQKRITYNALGKVKKVEWDDGRNVEYEYLPGGLLEKVSLSDGRSFSYQYDENKNIIRKTDQSGYKESYGYDERNQLIWIKNKKNQLKHFTYDAVGNVVSITDEMGYMTNYEYTRSGKVKKVTDAKGSIIEYEYDEMDNLITVIKRGQAQQEVAQTVYERDILGRIQKIIDPLGETEEFQYDRAGRMSLHKDKDGYITTYGYTVNGDISEVAYADGKRVELSYNALRQLIEIKDSLGITSLKRDESGRLNSVFDWKNREIQYRYGKHGEKLGMTYPDGYEVTYQYDEFLRLASMKAGSENIHYKYNRDGKLLQKQYADGLSSAYEYDEMGYITRLSHMSEDKILDQFEYQYDGNGNKTDIKAYRYDNEMASGQYHYEYDELSQLTGVYKNQNLLRAYEYDDCNNRIAKRERGKTTRYSYNALNQLTELNEFDEQYGGIGKKQFHYDKRGNVVNTYCNGELDREYVYNAANQMEAVCQSDGSLTRYTYNGLGKRVGVDSSFEKIEDVLDLTRAYHNLIVRELGGEKQHFAYDFGVICGERKQACYYLNDELGSPVRVVCPNEKKDEMMFYDEFGIPNDLGHGESQPFGFTGYQLEQSGYYYAQSRYYDPSLGRFLEKDHDQFINPQKEISWNQYLYCQGNPLNYVDYMGFDCGGAQNGAGITFDWEQYINEDNIGTNEGYIQTALDKLLQLLSKSLGKAASAATRPANIGIGTWAKLVESDKAWAASFGKNAAKFFEKISYVPAFIDGIVSAYNSYQSGSSVRDAVTDGVVDTGITAGSIWAATAIGGAVGGPIGAGVGFVSSLGIYLVTDVIKIDGKNLRSYVKDGVKWAEDRIEDTVDGIVDGVSNAIDSVGDTIASWLPW